MAVNVGLIGGLAEGLKSGIQSYDTERNYQAQKQKDAQAQAIQNKMYQANMLEHGLQDNGKNEDGTDAGISFTPQMQAQNDLKSTQTADELASYDPTSDKSKTARNYYSGLVNSVKPGAGAFVNNQNLSAHDLESKSALLGETVKGAYGIQGREITGARVNDSNQIKRDSLDERKNVNATRAGQAFEQDHIIQQLKKTNNSLDRAESLLNGTEPVTAKTFNVIQQDFINAMAPGGAATEGKVNREMVETLQEKLNELHLKFGDVKDLRAEQPQIVSNLKNLISQVKGDYSAATGKQALDIHDSFANSSNPGVQKTIQDKLKRYAPEAYAQRYGDQSSPGLIPSQAAQPQGLIPNQSAPSAAPLIDKNAALEEARRRGLVK